MQHYLDVLQGSAIMVPGTMHSHSEESIFRNLKGIKHGPLFGRHI